MHSQKISVNSIGIGMHHPANFQVRRPRGSGDYLFIHFLTSYRIRLDDRAQTNKAGSCIIFSPDARQDYGGDGRVNFGNDWLHLSDGEVGRLFEALALPVNTLMDISAVAFIPLMLREIRMEAENRNPHWEMSTDLKVRQFFIELSRAVDDRRAEIPAPRSEELRERFTRLRLVMQEQCDEKWDLERMAKTARMNRSRFATVYHNLFNNSPVNDLIEMRLNLARQYLLDTKKSVTDISALCGFNDVYYFCRQFKKKTGVSPGAFRRQGVIP